MIKCQKCGNITESATGKNCEVCGNIITTLKKDTHQKEIIIPWYDSSNIAKSFYTIFTEIIFNSKYFFALNKIKCFPFSAWVFALLAGSLSTTFEYIWEKIFNNLFISVVTNTQFSILLKSSHSDFLLYTPIIITLKILLSTIFFHLVLKLISKAKGSFSDTFVLFCYAEATALLTIIPGIGNMLAMISWSIVTINGLSIIHKIKKSRVIISFFVPFMLVIIILILFATAGTMLLLFTNNIFKDFLEFVR